MVTTTHSAGSARLIGGALSRRRFLAIVGLFWLYVTLSNVLYAYSFAMGVAEMTDAALFAPWRVRVLQHLILLPVVLLAFWGSLRIEWRPLRAAVALQFLFAAGFAAAAYPAMIAAHLWANAWHLTDQPPDPSPHHVEAGWYSLWIASFLNFFLTYGFGLALITGFALYSRYRDSEVRMVDLQREWSAARLAALRMQLSPHTLFNLLHTIRGQIEWDPAAAQSMIVQLGDLLRRLLNAGEQEFSTLAAEIQFARLYLELQQKRFADRIALALPAPADIPSLWVPSLILQPIVENAVVHGLAGHQGAVEISVSLGQEAQSLWIEVTNTMAATGTSTTGTASGSTAGSGAVGIGLTNVRERLAVQFGARAGVEARRGAQAYRVRIVLPALGTNPGSAPLLAGAA